MTLAVLCPGQGAQHAAMLDLALATPAGRRVVAAADAALGASVAAWAADDTARNVNAIAQPLVCVAQLAQWAALRDTLPPPAAFAGYSVGELACYALAGALDAAGLADLARARAAAMDATIGGAPGGLVGVSGLARAAVEALARAHDAHIAIVVDDATFVAGARADALAAFAAAAQSAGARVTPLGVAVPSHTPLLGAAVPAFRAVLERSPLRAPTTAVIAGIDGTAVTTRDRAVDTLARQLAEIVEWSRCVDALHERGCRVFLELGPGRALAKTATSRHDDVEARSVEDFRSLEAAARWVNTRL